ncbi:MAG: DUF2344 domain-containing protein [Chloroflexi bacterium]|nr:DUF2344 domain-containing protein [Chloroflexota bacterium]
MQRLRVTFTRGEEVKYISHLDLMRLWERALRRAAVPLAYSQGHSPHPHRSLSAPLPVGVTSEGELMDLLLKRRVSPHFFMSEVSQQLPQGIEIRGIQELGLQLPSLQSQVRFAEYRVVVKTEREPKEVEAAIQSLLAQEHLPWQHLRDTGPRHYDLRALVEEIKIVAREDSQYTLGLRLRTDSQASGRAEQVIAALGLPYPQAIHRIKLLLSTSSALSRPQRPSWRQRSSTKPRSR